MSMIPNRLYDPCEPFTHQVWDPFHDFHKGHVVRAPVHFPPPPTTAAVNAKFEWTETSEALVFKAHLPGLKKEEVTVEVEEGNFLRVSGDKRVEKEEKCDKGYRVERSSGKFLRRLRLPENARGNQMKACMENGILTITIPKHDAKHNTDDKRIHIS